MDRFVVKEPRARASFPQGNQMMAFPTNASGNMVSPENIYYGYLPNFNNGQQNVNMPQNMNSPIMGQTQTLGQTFNPVGPNSLPRGHNTSGIDPRYLAGYGDSNSQYILGGQQLQRNQPPNNSSSNDYHICQQLQRSQPPINSFGNDYQNRSFTGVERKPKHAVQVMALGGLESTRVEEMPIQKKPTAIVAEPKNTQNQPSFQHKFSMAKKPTELDLTRNEVQNPTMTRADKLKALHKGGPRAYSGPIEKVLKWHKSLQDIGILIIYEIVGKCVSVRPGESCAKILVVRDDNGPAMQVVYHEIDFLLPELKPPCTVRVVGRMMAGTSRLQAFNVRPATGDDVATLPRRAAVAAHHVAKLCKEFGH